MICSGLLLGSSHKELGDVENEEITPSLAIGISRGRFRKGYSYVDPNEDAVFAATDDTTTVLVVADGHNGFDAAHEAILAIADITPTVIGDDPESIVYTLTTAAIESVARTIPLREPPRDTSRTALTVCVIRGNELAAATVGDTSCFAATKHRVEHIGTHTRFLSSTTDPDTIRVDSRTIHPRAVVVVASDGFVDFTRPLDRTIRIAAKRQPLDVVDALIAAAFAGGAGDNIAVAVTHR